MGNFLVLAMPRSRSYWLSKFLSFQEWNCTHDIAPGWRGPEDWKSWFSQPFVGSVETGLAAWWRLIPEDCKVLVLRREVPEVLESLARTGLPFHREEMEKALRRIERKLEQVAARRNTKVLCAEDLSSSEVCREVFENLLGKPCPQQWLECLHNMNLQRDLFHQFRYLQANATQVQRLAKQAKQLCLQKFLRSPVGMEFSYQIEDFPSWFAEAKDMLRSHCELVGERVANPTDDFGTNLDWGILQRLHSQGDVFITTARSNGKLFGYLVTMINSDPLAVGEREGLQSIFYSTLPKSGLGIGMQRESFQHLRKLGVQRAIIRDGLRESAGALGRMALRLGGESYGQLYKIELGSE
jgi:hypothetical protein